MIAVRETNSPLASLHDNRLLGLRHRIDVPMQLASFCRAISLGSSPTRQEFVRLPELVGQMSAIEQKTPRLRRRRLSLAKKPSTALSQEHEVGVKWKTKRG